MFLKDINEFKLKCSTTSKHEIMSPNLCILIFLILILLERERGEGERLTQTFLREIFDYIAHF